MKAKLKTIYNPNIGDLANYCPKMSENFCILFRAMVGPQGELAEESFDIQVCTPLWFLSTLKQNDVIPGKHFFIILEYNFERIYSKIKQLIEAYSADNWNELAEKIARIGYWEFEDYVE
jgi:immunity protein 8 of polymorphic toxin system